MNKVAPHLFHHSISKKKQFFMKLLSIILWFTIWSAAAKIIDRKLFLPGPILVFTSLLKLASTESYWLSIFNSMVNILTGYAMAILLGTILAAISYRFRAIMEFIYLPLRIIRTIPVASFIILALLWVSSDKLSMLISFLMVLPIIYEYTLNGLSSIDCGLLEMAYLSRMPITKKLLRIYLPGLLSHLTAALSTGIGLAWKSGVAAEVIGISRNSIGNHLNQSKIYLETPELFAWTITIIIISMLFEIVLKKLLGRPT